VRVNGKQFVYDLITTDERLTIIRNLKHASLEALVRILLPYSYYKPAVKSGSLQIIGD
jgi:hypothetical protein